MYVIGRGAIDALPTGRSDMPDLVNRLAADGSVRAHVLNEAWTDVADLADYEAVNLDSDAWDDL